MTENYEQELELIDGATVGAWKEYEGVIRYEINPLGDFYNYFNPAHMRQRIEREMAKDARLAEQEARINELDEALTKQEESFTALLDDIQYEVQESMSLGGAAKTLREYGRY